MLEKIIEIFKVIFLGIVEGISEWLPISSSGHMLLIDEFINLNASSSFKDVFFIVIQLGAILAVLVLFFKKINPFNFKKDNINKIDKDIINIWIKVIVACIPGVIIALLFDNYVDKYLHTPFIISLMLIVYGIAFIVIEKLNKNRKFRVNSLSNITYKDALIIGLFQVLSIIPGTSRSGATILGALLIGINREVASEFTFFLSIPVMFGMSALRVIEFGFNYSNGEVLILLIGMLVAFIVSIITIKFLMNYIKKHDFKIFGMYRIILGGFLLLYFLIK